MPRSRAPSPMSPRSERLKSDPATIDVTLRGSRTRTFSKLNRIEFRPTAAVEGAVSRTPARPDRPGSRPSPRLKHARQSLVRLHRPGTWPPPSSRDQAQAQLEIRAWTEGTTVTAPVDGVSPSDWCRRRPDPADSDRPGWCRRPWSWWSSRQKVSSARSPGGTIGATPGAVRSRPRHSLASCADRPTV